MIFFLFYIYYFYYFLLKVNSSVVTKQINKVEVCSDSQFFDTTSLQCKYCDPNSTNHKTPNQTSVDIYGNFLSCKCIIGYQEVNNDCSQVFINLLSYLLLLILLLKFIYLLIGYIW